MGIVSQQDISWMQQALDLAKRAQRSDEVPVGAVVVCDDKLIATGWNQSISLCDPTAHAEIIALRQAALRLGNYRLTDVSVYVSLEPCAMCAGALVLARIDRVVFGAYDPKAGACGSLRNVVQDHRLNHWCTVVGGVLEEECSEVLRGFFARLRQERCQPRGVRSARTDGRHGALTI